MQFNKTPQSTFLWFLCAIIPVLNLYWLWKVSKIVANTNFESGD